MRSSLVDTHRRVWTVLVVSLPLAAMACAGPGDTGGTPEQETAADVPALANGVEAVIVAPDGSTEVRGYAVTVRKHDGTTVPAIFRGPRKLLDQLNDGSLEFQEDSLPPRVRLLESGEELRPLTPPSEATRAP